MFHDRSDAGHQLAIALQRLSPVDPVVLALPRGGVPVALPIARALHAPLDLLLVRKIGAPGQPELALGAVAEDGAVVRNHDVIRWSGATEAFIENEAAQQRGEIDRRRALYTAGRPPVPVAGRSAIVVDDGIATGATMRAALQWLRTRAPLRIVLAVPVAARDSLDALRPWADDVVCLATPEPFHAVGVHYADFDQVEDAQVIEMLAAP